MKMKAKNTNTQEMHQALAAINEKYEGNIKFKRFDDGKTINFTLTVINSKAKGGRYNHMTSRYISAACWHVHGDFFEALLAINDNAVIISGGTLKIDKTGGNWTDRNIGSVAHPMMYSDSCLC